MTPEEKRRDKRLQKTYGISLAEYNTMLGKQGGGCAICGRPGKTRSLAVDHDHKYAYLRRMTEKYPKDRMGIRESEMKFWPWQASAKYGDRVVYGHGRTKSEAIQGVKIKLKRASIRGLLCPHCNSGLRKYGDDPTRLHAAGTYLERFNGGL